jgi:glycosyltransferase involved in cell wall biosynthesis
VYCEKVVQGVGKIDNASRPRQEQLRCNDVVSQPPEHRAGMESLVLPSERSLASERQRRMRILLACAAYPPQGKGGGPAASESIARALRARGHDVHVITVADEETHEVRDGIDIRTMRSLNVYWNYWKRNPLYKKLAWHALENGNPRALLRMRAAIAGIRPDIVVTISCENINVATWLAARMLGIPTAHVVQSHFLLCWRGSMFHDGRNCDIQCRACRYSSAGKRLLSHLVDGVIAESRHMLDRHAAAGYFAGARQKVIPAAIDWPVRSEPRPQTDMIKVGYIGMVTPNKGVETLARSAARLGEASPFRYLIAGDGPGAYVESVSAIFPQDRFQFLGWTDPAAFYPAIDVLVVPSLWSEAFVEAEENGSQDFHNDRWWRFNPERDACKWASGRAFSYGDGSGRSHPNWHMALFSPRYLRRLLEDAGLTGVREMDRSEVRGHDHGWINLGVSGTKPSVPR